MDVEVLPPSPIQAKPLALLGRDEMNLAEFPITLLTDRVPKNQTVAIYQDEIYDERSGMTLTRKLTISAGNHGLTTAIDDEVILSLIQLTKQKNNFTDRKVEFSRHELVQLLGWSMGGASYDRILESLKRWTSVFLQYENAWRDNRTKAWTTAGFHIIDKYEISDGRAASDQLDLIPSYIVWGQDIFESFQAGYLKPLDYDLCMGLSNSTAKRMYRFLDKRFHHKPEWIFDLKELAHEHIGLGRNYEGPAHLRRNLQPAIEELVKIGFLEPLPDSQRYVKDGKQWKIRLSQPRPPALTDPSPTTVNDQQPSPLTTELTDRGVTRKTAIELLNRHTAEAVRFKLEIFDWLIEKQDKRVVKSPAGYLVKSIEDDYAAPKGFESKAERQKRQEALQAKELHAAEARRQQRQQEARQDAERKAIADYWNSLLPEQQAELDAASLAEADQETLALEKGHFKEMGQQIRRNDYIRQLLKSRESLPA
jgi:Replication initiator protein A